LIVLDQGQDVVCGLAERQSGGVLDVFGLGKRIPAFLGFFVLAILFSTLNDEHRCLAGG